MSEALMRMRSDRVRPRTRMDKERMRMDEMAKKERAVQEVLIAPPILPSAWQGPPAPTTMRSGSCRVMSWP